MHCNRLLHNCIQIDILSILLCLTIANAHFLNARSRDYVNPRDGPETNDVKGVDTSTNGQNGLVEAGAVGEVFVPKTFPLGSQEPSCEQLRAMWIFSKRQSRAAEITNEIPTYRDPFTYNVWDPLYANSRSMGSLRMGGRERGLSPVFGRVVSREPIIPQRMTYVQRPRLGENGGMARFYGAETRPGVGSATAGGAIGSVGSGGSSSRRSTQNRYIGSPSNVGGATNGGVTGVGTSSTNPNSVAVQGSFQKLKELIWTERAKELTQQRRAEELAARAAVLKEIANGQNVQSNYKQTYGIKSDSILMDENRSPDSSGNRLYNDARIPIASGQTNKNEHRGGGGGVSAAATAGGGGFRASTRRIGTPSSGRAINRKEMGSIFSSNSATGSQSGRNARINLAGADVDLSDREPAVIGVPRTYPIRQSHFRERNRSLLKQYPPSDYYQRDIRNNLDAYQFDDNTDNININGLGKYAPLYVANDDFGHRNQDFIPIVAPDNHQAQEQFLNDLYMDEYNGY